MTGEGGKSHRKKKAGRKAEKKKATKKKGEDQNNAEAAKRNPKAFIFSSRGKAKVQKARSAEKDQRRMHGRWSTFGSCIVDCIRVSKTK